MTSLEAPPRPSIALQAATPYADAILTYAELPYVRLSVPGHAGQAASCPELAAAVGSDVLRLDVAPLIEGIDQGAAPTPRQRSLELAAEAWGARRTWFLTNGGSSSNLVACLSLRQLGRRIVAQRNVHSSVVDGMILAGLDGSFVDPVLDPSGVAHGITPAALAAALDGEPGAAAAFVVSPSSFGAVADVPALAEVAHAYGALLVVDAAWGAHFGFHPDLPDSPLAQGADLVTMSTHKVAGSLTQSALLHLGHGPYAAELEGLISRSVRSTQSTSASALLMLSVDLARSALAVHGEARIGRSMAVAERLRRGIRARGRFADLGDRFRGAHGVAGLDPLRVVIETRRGGISGHEASAQLFREHQIHLEMATESAIVAVIGAGSEPDVGYVLDALHALPGGRVDVRRPVVLPRAGERRMSLREAYFSRSELVDARRSVGRISVDSLAAYPPGVPNLLPGETITSETVEFLTEVANSPFGHVRGAPDGRMTRLRVVAA